MIKYNGIFASVSPPVYRLWRIEQNLADHYRLPLIHHSRFGRVCDSYGRGVSVRIIDRDQQEGPLVRVMGAGPLQPDGSLGEVNLALAYTPDAWVIARVFPFLRE